MTERIAARGWLQPILLLTVIAILLSPTLGGEFLWDDTRQIVESTTIGDLSLIPFYFTHNVVQSAGSEGVNAPGVDIYRPLFMVSLAAVYTVNGPDPFWFRLAVLAAHLLVALLLWLLAVRWLDSRLAAAAGVLFFALHPVTAEAYLWASAISEPLATAGLLAAVLLVDSWSRDRKADGRAWLAAGLSGVVFLAGLLSKEAVLMALPVLSIFLVVVRGVRPRFLTPMWVAAAVFLVMRSMALDGLQATGVDTAQRIAALKIYPVLVVDALRAVLTMTPIGIRHLSWEYESIGWAMSVGCAVICAVLLAGTIRLRRSMPLPLAAALTAGLMLAPIALVATVPGWGGFGRYLYLPLAVTVVALAELATVLHRRLVARQPRFRWAIPAIVVAALAVELVGMRHALWVYDTQENLARAAIEIFPAGPDGWEWLGNVHLDREDLPKALDCYRKATERGPELYRPRHNFAAALLYNGRPAEALEQLAILDRHHPPTAPAANVAVIALMELGRWDEAVRRLVAGLDRDPTFGPLADSAARLIAGHPQSDAMRVWLTRELEAPEHAQSAAVILPMLGPHDGS